MCLPGGAAALAITSLFPGFPPPWSSHQEQDQGAYEPTTRAGYSAGHLASAAGGTSDTGRPDLDHSTARAATVRKRRWRPGHLPGAQPTKPTPHEPTDLSNSFSKESPLAADTQEPLAPPPGTRPPPSPSTTRPSRTQMRRINAFRFRGYVQRNRHLANALARSLLRLRAAGSWLLSRWVGALAFPRTCCMALAARARRSRQGKALFQGQTQALVA